MKLPKHSFQTEESLPAVTKGGWKAVRVAVIPGLVCWWVICQGISFVYNSVSDKAVGSDVAPTEDTANKKVMTEPVKAPESLQPK